jgi:hypothetical protein
VALKWNATCANRKYHLLDDWNDIFGFFQKNNNVPHGNWPKMWATFGYTIEIISFKKPTNWINVNLFIYFEELKITCNLILLCFTSRE